MGRVTQTAPQRYGLTENNSLYIHMRRYQEWMGVHHYAESTIKNRGENLLRFMAWCAERDLSTPQEITKPILERYQRHLFYRRKEDGSPLSVNLQATVLVEIKMWFKWLAKENYILFNPATELELPKRGKRLPSGIFSHEELTTLFNLPRLERAEGVRDRAMLELMYSTGIRRSEVANLQVYDIDWQRSLLIIREGKGMRDRVVPIGERALKWLDKYVRDRRPELLIDARETALFIRTEGDAFIPYTVSDQVSYYMKKAHIKKPGCCHLFRHTMATHMLENGADIRYIQEMLGHANINTTQIYTKVSVRRLQAVHAETLPNSFERRCDELTEALELESEDE